MEARGDLGEVVAARLVGFAQRGVDVFLAGDNHPGAAFAANAEFFRDGLKVQHQLRVLADELTHLVDEEDDAVTRALGVQVVAHQFSETFDVDAVAVARIVEPFTGRLGRHVERSTEASDNVVTMKVDGVAFGIPGVAIGGLESIFEDIEAALGDEVALHVGHMRRVA